LLSFLRALVVDDEGFTNADTADEVSRAAATEVNFMVWRLQALFEREKRKVT
jgi:hypothetical protein